METSGQRLDNVNRTHLELARGNLALKKLYYTTHPNSLSTFEGDVEAAKSVSWQRIGATLEHNGRRLVGLHDLGHDGHEDVLVVFVVDTVAKREVDGVVLALAGANVLKDRGGKLEEI